METINELTNALVKIREANKIFIDQYKVIAKGDNMVEASRIFNRFIDGCEICEEQIRLLLLQDIEEKVYQKADF